MAAPIHHSAATHRTGLIKVSGCEIKKPNPAKQPISKIFGAKKEEKRGIEIFKLA